MGYYVSKEGKNGGWYVEHEARGKRRRVRKKDREWELLGFANCKTIVDARLNAKQLTLDEKRNRKTANFMALENLSKELNEKLATIFPSKVLEDFERTKIGKKQTTKARWITAKKAALAVGLPLREWNNSQEDFYNWFEEKRFSPDYSNRLIKLLNRWGKFYSHRLDRSYNEIDSVRGDMAIRLARAQEKAKGRAGKSKRLSFALLEKKKRELRPDTYKWLYLSVAFGLRPEEINTSLQTKGKWGEKIENGELGLHIYQPKLERKFSNPKKCWKRIPIRTKEQKTALTFVREQEFAAISYRTLLNEIRKVFGRGFTTYAGRKEFFPYLVGQGFARADVSKWLGHRSLETAVRHYDDPEDDALPDIDDEAA